jgi:hypothetical protein
MTSYRSLFALGLTVFALSACGSLKQDLGLGRNPPDEFAVMDRPPLSIPPDFGLRPPQPGAPRPQEVDIPQHASESLFGGGTTDTSNTASPPAEPSDTEKALMAQTGADKAPADIRSTINRESAQKVVTSEHLLDDLLWWKKDQKPSAVVDAPAEAERLKEAKDKGDQPNQSATPVIERDKSGWLGL